MSTPKKSPIFSYRAHLKERLPFTRDVVDLIIGKVYDEQTVTAEQYRMYNLLRCLPDDHPNRAETEKYSDWLDSL